MGRVHEKLVGPHSHWSSQLAFDSAQFEPLIAWLEQNRHGHDVLVRGLTGDDLVYHRNQVTCRERWDCKFTCRPAPNA